MRATGLFPPSLRLLSISALTQQTRNAREYHTLRTPGTRFNPGMHGRRLLVETEVSKRVGPAKLGAANAETMRGVVRLLQPHPRTDPRP